MIQENKTKWKYHVDGMTENRLSKQGNELLAYRKERFG